MPQICTSKGYSSDLEALTSLGRQTPGARRLWSSALLPDPEHLASNPKSPVWGGDDLDVISSHHVRSVLKSLFSASHDSANVYHSCSLLCEKLLTPGSIFPDSNTAYVYEDRVISEGLGICSSGPSRLFHHLL